MTQTETRDSELAESVRQQVKELPLAPGKPLVVADADEVLLQFVRGLEQYLEREGMWLDLKSFALTGNIKHRSSNDVVLGEEVKHVLDRFFAAETGSLEAVPGAATALDTLSLRAQIVVLTNVPFEQRVTRQDMLTGHGMPYPVIANAGLKGPAVRHMADRIDGAPVFFIDDIPHNLRSVADWHPESHLIHYIADSRLSRFLPKPDEAHHRADDWPDLRRFIEHRLGSLGY